MRTLVILVVVVGLAVGAGLVWLDRSREEDNTVTANTDLLITEDVDLSQFERAIGPYDWQFPADHGPHPTFQTEWWYYTGNLADDSGRRFGYQFTIFRRNIDPAGVESESEWRTNQLYLAHFTVTDVAGNQFFHDQRLSRGAAGLAGATTDPVYRVWLENWEITALNDNATQTQITAATDSAAIDLTLEQVKPPALQGDSGLSAKSAEVGNASYYYSLSRLLTNGTITINGQAFTISGASWMDHEFSTSALGLDAQGWDWFGLHLDDNRELMLGQIRLVNGGIEPAFGGLLVRPDGSTFTLESSDLTIMPSGTWTSPHTQITYPAGWEITVDIGEAEPLRLAVTPLIDDQELNGEGIVYWEGAVRIAGDAAGYGYAELTGYQDAMRGRF
ncbi:MAG: carotenoid 1,2-hydratase [Chloroflexi bacterium]|nr:carotenoid 1,2-hydratase [Chloroflexota bacterium]